MPFYSVLIEGSGLGNSPSSTAIADEIRGFFTTRIVLAGDAVTAKQKALAVVEKEWSSKPYSSQPGASRLRLQAENCSTVGALRGIFRRPAGYTFYRE